MSSNYGYKPSDASTFNQLVQQGLSAEDAATQTGVSNNPGAYGYGTNSNLGSIIPGAGGAIGGATDAPGLTSVSYPQSSTGQPAQQPAQTTTPAAGTSYSTFQDPAQRAAAAAAAAPPVQEAVPAASPITESQPDARIISSTPAASSGFGYGTGINNPSVAPTTAADTVNANTSGIPIRNEEGAVVEGIRTNPETGETYYTTVTDQQRVASEQAATIDANTSGIPIRNEEGAVVEGIRTNPETGETYYTDPPAADSAEFQVKSFSAGDVPPASLGKPGESLEAQASAAAGGGSTPIGAETVTAASQTQAQRLLAQRQKALDNQKKLVNNNGDWRVRISLAESSDYLYNAPFLEDGILAPLKATFGVIFPYTPTINVGYKATYSSADLTHSNYRNYFYQGSAVDSVRITGTFTAQDTVEAQYLLAVIHFFRSATKMFYGQDAQRGAPPPLLFISGLGEYQFNNQACVLSSFDYNLPADVDYIRAGSPNNNGTDLLKRRTSTQNNLPTNAISGALGRLSQLFSGQGIQKGGIVYQNAPSNLSKNSPTYVPTKIDISLNLYPVVTRSQASRQFSLKQFANGDLVKQGFW
jgi:hypothetical protein